MRFPIFCFFSAASAHLSDWTPGRHYAEHQNAEHQNVKQQYVERQYAEHFHAPLEVKNGSAGLYSTASENGFGSLFVYEPNATSYEWWYFDAMSDDLKTSVVFQPDWNYTNENPLLLRVSFSFEDGSTSNLTIPGSDVFFSTVGNGVSAIAKDGSFKWISQPDMSSYTIMINLPEYNVTGQLNYQTVAPAHGPCGPAISGAPLDITWDLLWVNPMPDAQVTVDLKVNDTTLAFSGIGYHDKNFAAFDFTPHMNQWYWGHGRAGEFSIVWFYHLNSANELSTSAYIAQNNTILYSACSGITVRPFGENVGYPAPQPTEATIDGYTIHIDAGSLGEFAFTATATQTHGLAYGYGRWIGTLEGGRVGDQNATGRALWEQMGPF